MFNRASFFCLLQLVLRLIGLQYISALLLCMMGLAISAVARNPFIAVIPSLLLFLVSPMRLAEISVGLHRFMTLFPANAMGCSAIWATPDFYIIFGLIIGRPTMTVIFSLIGICVLTVFCFFITRQMEPSN